MAKGLNHFTKLTYYLLPDLVRRNCAVLIGCKLFEALMAVVFAIPLAGCCTERKRKGSVIPGAMCDTVSQCRTARIRAVCDCPTLNQLCCARARKQPLSHLLPVSHSL